MSGLARSLAALVRPDPRADRVVPASGYTASLVVFAAAAMSFLAVFALALSISAGRLADRWGAELAQGATVRLSAPADQMQIQTDAALSAVQSTAGVADARVLSDADQQALLTPWFGEGLDLSRLPVPRLIEIRSAPGGFDAEGLRLRLAAEAPGAVLDDHSRWRQPLQQSARRLRLLGAVSTLLIAATTAAIIVLAAHAALSANAQVIRVLRLVGATDAYIANAFVRRFTLRAASGSVIGMAFAMLGLAALRPVAGAEGILAGVGFGGWSWLLPLTIPPLAAMVAFVATRVSATRRLESFS